MPIGKWTQLSIDYANQRSYLDDLFAVYPTIPEGIRDIDKGRWTAIEQAFVRQDNLTLIKEVLKLKLSPVKDSYIAYMKRDRNSIERNPKTVDRICGRLYEMGIDKMFELCSAAKETNRQIGPMFKAWLNRKTLGIVPVDMKQFTANNDNAILDASDKVMQNFAKEILGYEHPKGLDFVGRFNGKYVIGEAKFLTDYGGHQNAQFNDAIATVEATGVKAIKIAILDGVLYIKSTKMHRLVTTKYCSHNILSALVLREFLYQV